MKGELHKWWRMSMITLFAAATFSGCTWPGAYLRHSWEVASQFDAYHIYPDFQYFTSGTLKDPRAVLALKPEYTLNSEGWQSVQMTPEKLRQWILALKKDSFVEYNTYANGAQLIDNQGKVAGYYYSVWEFPLIRFSKSNQLMIHRPAHEYRLDNDLSEFLSGDSDMSGD